MSITQPRSKHFSLKQIAEGVFAAIATEGGAAICNAGLIDLGKQVVIFDTFLTPQAAQDLQQAAFHLFGRTQQIIVNSHWHNDHIWGNQVFAADALIFSSSRTRQLIAANSQEEADWFTTNAAQELATYQSQLQTANDEQQRQMKGMLGYFKGLIEAMPHFLLCLPSITFDQRHVLHGTKRIAELIEFENGHTESDTVLYLPQDGVLFMGDLLFVGFHPYLGDGDPQEQQAALRKLGQLKAKHFIPGHGPLGILNDLQQLINYIDYCRETAQRLVSEESGYEERITGLKIIEPYHKWLLASAFPANIKYLCKRLDPTARK